MLAQNDVAQPGLALATSVRWQQHGFQHQLQVTPGSAFAPGPGAQLAIEVDAGVGAHRQPTGAARHRSGPVAAQVQIGPGAGHIDHGAVADNNETIVDLVDAVIVEFVRRQTAQGDLAAVQYLAVAATAGPGGRVGKAGGVQQRVLTDPDGLSQGLALRDAVGLRVENIDATAMGPQGAFHGGLATTERDRLARVDLDRRPFADRDGARPALALGLQGQAGAAPTHPPSLLRERLIQRRCPDFQRRIAIHRIDHPGPVTVHRHGHVDAGALGDVHTAMTVDLIVRKAVLEVFRSQGGNRFHPHVSIQNDAGTQGLTRREDRVHRQGRAGLRHGHAFRDGQPLREHIGGHHIIRRRRPLGDGNGGAGGDRRPALVHRAAGQKHHPVRHHPIRRQGHTRTTIDGQGAVAERLARQGLGAAILIVERQGAAGFNHHFFQQGEIHRRFLTGGEQPFGLKQLVAHDDGLAGFDRQGATAIDTITAQIAIQGENPVLRRAAVVIDRGRGAQGDVAATAAEQLAVGGDRAAGGDIDQAAGFQGDVAAGGQRHAAAVAVRQRGGVRCSYLVAPKTTGVQYPLGAEPHIGIAVGAGQCGSCRTAIAVYHVDDIGQGNVAAARGDGGVHVDLAGGQTHVAAGGDVQVVLHGDAAGAD